MSENEVKEKVVEEAVVENVESTEKQKLWNPNVAANWSCLFTPIFGAWLHSKNWKALGDDAKAKKSMYWVYAGFVMLFIPYTALIFLLAWYFASARSQMKYVKEELGNEYERKPWKKPLKFGVVGLVVLMIFLGISSACSGGGAGNNSENKLVVKGLYIGQPIEVAGVFYASLTGTDIVFDRASYGDIYDPTDLYIASESSSGTVSVIVFGSYFVNEEFNVQDLSSEDFAQQFIDSYNIPEMEVFVESDASGWKYNDGNGTEIKIYPSKSIIISKVPAFADRNFN